MPVTHGVAGSSPVTPARNAKSCLLTAFFVAFFIILDKMPAKFIILFITKIFYMKVKIYLEPPAFISSKTEAAPFPYGFSSIGFVPFEPLCPFCGKHLREAVCHCQQFADAATKLKAQYAENPSDVYISPEREILVVPSVFIHDVQIITEAVATPQNVLTLFDEGGMAKSSPFKSGVWFVSSGDLDGDCLTFYARQKYSEQIYCCTVRDIPAILLADCAVPEKIVLYEYKQKFAHHPERGQCIGNYTPVMEKVVLATLSHDEFLQKLQTL